MKKKLVLILSVVMVVALVFSLSACGKTVQKIAEKAIEDAVGENIANEDTAGEDTAGEDTEDAIISNESLEISSDDTGVAISNEQGEVVSGDNAKVPSGWPSEIPVYPDLKVTYSAQAKDENQKDSYAIFAEVTKGTVKEVYDWHKSKMSGWEVLSDSFSTSDGNDAFSFQWKNDDYETLLMAGSDGTTITYTFTVVQATSE